MGWTDEAIYSAVSVCALFNFYNRWIDATGVHPRRRKRTVSSASKQPITDTFENECDRAGFTL